MIDQPDKELTCCVSCGRETSSKSGLCSRCRGKGREEEIGRHTRSLKTIQGSAIPEINIEDEDIMPRSDIQYHGPSPRDDI